MNDYPDFEQNYCSKTANKSYRNGHISIRIMKWIAVCDKCYENIKYYDLIGTVLTCPNEPS